MSLQLIRVWDPRSCSRVTKLKGHTDNVRALRLNRDGTLVSKGVREGWGYYLVLVREGGSHGGGGVWREDGEGVS